MPKSKADRHLLRRERGGEAPALGIGKRVRKGVFEFKLGKVGDGLAQQTLHADIGVDDGDYCIIFRAEAQRASIELTSVGNCGAIMLKVKRR